ncbi:MAG: hypothetical protein GC192_15285 [Bacteroidetes bacterium]|nr:hypothetical protein [Bacteroidota bacterium]
MSTLTSRIKNLIFLFTALWLCGGCCDDESKGTICEKGFEEINGKCECPEGSFRAYGFCRELADNEWYAVTSGCPCQDTVFFKITGVQGDTAGIRLNDDIIIDPPNPGWSVRSSFAVRYFSLVNGDSIAPLSLPYGHPCNADNFGAAEFYELFYGKFSPSGDTLNMKIIFRDFQTPSIVKDSCFVTFHK